MHKNYLYGLLRPTENAALVSTEMLGAHRFHNELLSIERGRRAAIRELLWSDPDLLACRDRAEAAEQALLLVLAEVRAHRAQTRKRAIPPDLRERLRAGREKASEEKRAFAERKKIVDEAPETIAGRDRIRAFNNALVRGARELRQCQWGTGGLVEQRVQAAAKMPYFDGTKPSDPHFISRMEDGTIAVQFIQGLPAEDIFNASNTQLRIDPVDPKAWYDPVRGVRRKSARTTVHMRVGSEGRKPLWASFPMVMHRPLPDRSILRVAQIRREQVGTGFEWCLLLSLDCAQSPVRTPTAMPGSAVAVNMGWRLFGPHDLRVATFLGSEGEPGGEVRLPPAFFSKLEKIQSLQSIRDRNFNEARAKLVAWLREKLEETKEGDPSPFPPWLEAAQKTLPHWKGIGRLFRLALHWRAHRFAGDEGGFLPLEGGKGWGFRYNDHHLWNWVDHERQNLARARTEFYRLFAADLASRYETLIIDTMDLAEYQETPPPESTAPTNDVAQADRRLASPSLLRRILLEAFQSRQGKVFKPSALHGTQTHLHHACGKLGQFDAAPSVEVTCPHCQVIFDQDLNACQNYLQCWKDRPAQEEKAPSAPKENRWERVRRLKKERDARAGEEASSEERVA